MQFGKVVMGNLFHCQAFGYDTDGFTTGFEYCIRNCAQTPTAAPP